MAREGREKERGAHPFLLFPCLLSLSPFLLPSPSLPLPTPLTKTLSGKYCKPIPAFRIAPTEWRNDGADDHGGIDDEGDLRMELLRERLENWQISGKEPLTKKQLKSILQNREDRRR